MANPSDIAKLTAILSAGYPNWNVTEFTNDVYFEDLKDIPPDLLFMGAKHCRTSTTRDQRFAPSAGEIRIAVSEIRRQIEGIPSALEAWGELLKAPKNEETRKVVDNVIEIRPYQWSHPLVRRVAMMMGFPKFPDWEKESFERTAFFKVYEKELENFLRQADQPLDVQNFIETARSKQIESGVSAVTKKLEANNG